MHLNHLTLEEAKTLLLDGVSTIKFGIRSYFESEGKDMVVIDQRFFEEGLQMLDQERKELLQKLETTKGKK
jgi:hypothetical protein